MKAEAELYYTTIGHIEDTGVVGALDIRALSSIGIPAYSYKLSSTSVKEFLERVDNYWIREFIL